MGHKKKAQSSEDCDETLSGTENDSRHSFSSNRTRPEGNVFHPVTGIRYTLTVRDYGWQQIEMEETDSRWVCPKHCAVLEYGVDPVLTPDQMVVRGLPEGDRPYLKQENQFEPTSSGCSAIAVIGGGVGMCQSGGAVRYASSGLYFEPQKEIEWRLSSRIPDRDPLEISEFSCL